MFCFCQDDALCRVDSLLFYCTTLQAANINYPVLTAHSFYLTCQKSNTWFQQPQLSGVDNDWALSVRPFGLLVNYVFKYTPFELVTSFCEELSIAEFKTALNQSHASAEEWLFHDKMRPKCILHHGGTAYWSLSQNFYGTMAFTCLFAW